MNINVRKSIDFFLKVKKHGKYDIMSSAVYVVCKTMLTEIIYNTKPVLYR